MSSLCITVRFLQPFAHGRVDGGEPEWPPSPLRVFQALVAAAAARWNERTRVAYAVPALDWLARQPVPVVVAAIGIPSDVKYRLYVPDNVADIVAKSWRGGNLNASIADYRTEKDVRPTQLTGDAVHYLYSIADGDAEFAQHKQTLIDAARSVTHLGWGVDMVAGNAVEMSEAEANQLQGERWRPTPDGSGTRLRVPRDGTLAALMNKHTAFLNRLSNDGFRPVPPLTAFDTVGYRRDTDPGSRPWVAFRIVSVDPDLPNPAFDTPRRCHEVAAWVRNATGAVCHDLPDVASFVHGHDPTDNTQPLRGEHADQRCMFLPLPTINAKLNRVESIRRVLVAVPPGSADRLDRLRRLLPGQELIALDGSSKGMLTELATIDWVRDQYTGTGSVWSTVTPVIWPGHDDHDADKAEPMLRKAFVDAGLPQGVVDGITELEWRRVGFRAGVDLAGRYVLNPLPYPRYHVRVRFSKPIRGPLAVGAGRYRGLGLFARDDG